MAVGSGMIRDYERSVNPLEHVSKPDGRPEADALREDRRMETVKGSSSVLVNQRWTAPFRQRGN